MRVRPKLLRIGLAGGRWRVPKYLFRTDTGDRADRCGESKYAFTAVGTILVLSLPLCVSFRVSPSKRYVHSLHCQSAVSMGVHRVDPSLALAFYLPDRAAFQDLVKRIGEVREARVVLQRMLRKAVGLYI